MAENRASIIRWVARTYYTHAILPRVALQKPTPISRHVRLMYEI